MKQFSLNHNNVDLVVEFDTGAIFWYRVRLIVNDQIADERAVFMGSTRLRTMQPYPLKVDAEVGLFGPKRVFLAEGDQKIQFTKG